MSSGKWMLTRMMRKLLHRCGRTVMMQRRKQAQATAFRGSRTRRCYLVLPSNDKLARIARVMTHVMAHMRSHVGNRVRMMRRVALRMEVVMLLGRCLGPRRWLNARTGIC